MVLSVAWTCLTAYFLPETQGMVLSLLQKVKNRLKMHSSGMIRVLLMKTAIVTVVKIIPELT